MRSAVVSFASIGGRDNPTGRLDALYHIVMEHLRDPAYVLPEDELTCLLDLLPRRHVTNLRQVVKVAHDATEIRLAIEAALQLTFPSPELSDGLTRVSKQLLRAEHARLTAERDAIDARLRSIHLPTE